MQLSYTAGEGDCGRTVLSVLRHEMRISGALVRRLKQTSSIHVDGEPVFVNRTVISGETVTVCVTAAEPPCDNLPERGKLDILFENEGLLAVNKTAGLLVHPSHARYTGTLSNLVAGYLEDTTGFGSCHAVNRLDRDTSGVVLFAKNSHMKARAAEALSRPDAIREYIAAVYGIAPERGTIDAPIGRLEVRNMLRVVSEDGQRAVTHYERERILATEAGDISRLRLRLETGRTHQIRVHLRHLGYPVLGDILYNTGESMRVSETLGIRSHALHAERLGFTEPLSGEYIILTAVVPESLRKIENS